MQQKAQLILIELDAATAASSTPTTLTTAHAVHISRVGSRLVPLRPASAVGGSRGADETAALVCSVELRDGGATSLLRLVGSLLASGENVSAAKLLTPPLAGAVCR